MKQNFISIAEALLTIIASLYKIGRRLYRKFCIKFLWKKLHVKTSVYHQWHDRRAAKLQAALDNEHVSLTTYKI